MKRVYGLSELRFLGTATLWMVVINLGIAFIDVRGSDFDGCGPAKGTPTAVLSDGPKLAALFVQNRGQWPDESLRFMLNSSGTMLGIAEGVIRFQRRSLNAVAQVPLKEFSIDFPGSRSVPPEGFSKATPVFHFLKGSPDPRHNDVPAWSSVVYPGLFDGIDLRIIGQEDGFKFEVIVAPGADWRLWRARCQGIHRLEVRTDGSLVYDLGEGFTPLVDSPPEIYQVIDGKKVSVAGGYVLLDEWIWGFTIWGTYDPSRPLVMDPQIVWSSYLGGRFYDFANSVAVDHFGNLFVAGDTQSDGWVNGGFNTVHSPEQNYDGFVAKFNASGEHLWSTFFGGESSEYAHAVAVDSAGNAVVTGYTSSTNWAKNGFATHYLGGYQDAYVLKLSPRGDHLWSSYLGASGDDEGDAITVDGQDNIVVAGTTKSSGWVKGGYHTNYTNLSPSFGDGFVAKISSQGQMLWSTYLGGPMPDDAKGIAVDASGNIFVTGMTTSDGWIKGGINTKRSGNSDAYLVKLKPDGSHDWSTYLGGNNPDSGLALALDLQGNILITGLTISTGWIHGGYDLTLAGDGSKGDGFVAKYSPSGDFLWSSYIGGTAGDAGWAVTSDHEENVYVTGYTDSAGWVSGGFDTAFRGYSVAGLPLTEAFLVKLNAAGEHQWSTYIRGTSGRGVAVDASTTIYVAGYTEWGDWAVGGADTKFNGSGDGFVAAIRETADNTGSLKVVISPPEAITAGAQWRQVGTDTWHASGEIESGISVGSVIVEFKDIAAWGKPQNVSVTTVSGQIIQVMGIYQPLVRVIHFAGRTWNVKNGTNKGPGPNNWSDSQDSVWVDTQGCLHLKIRKVGSSWHCAEVWTTETTHYGLHRFYVMGRPDQMDSNVVLSPFLYHDDEHEIDIEFSRWGNPLLWPSSTNSQYVVQPGSTSGNTHRYQTSLNGDLSTHYFDWQPNEIRFKSFHGHYPEPPDSNYLIDQWPYTGPDIPADSLGLNIHINLWLMNGLAPGNGQEVEMVFKDIDYPPLAPGALRATDIVGGGFTANWDSVSKATGYRIDLSTNRWFSNYIFGYQDVDVGNLVSLAVTGLYPGVTYYCRIRAYNTCGTSDNGSTISVQTPALRIGFIRQNTNLILDWPAESTDWILESTAQLPAVSWTRATVVPATPGRQTLVTNEMTGSAQFFRLRRP
jgi:hypothetical protein